MKNLHIRLFKPLLAGGNLRDRLVACVGAFLGIGLAGLTYAEISPFPHPALVAPMGASAVLLFAVPSSPLAQPWSIIGGNCVSVLMGLAIAQLPLAPLAEAGLAVASAIAIMSILRCLHPPGGAVALSAVLAGPAVAAGHYELLAVPVVLNSVLLVAIGWFFHRYSGHSYPHRAVPVMWRDVPAEPKPSVSLEDVDKALADLGETFDVSREDLALLFGLAETHALERQKAR
ncbi:HPP family protein [Sphingobium sp. SCG-1]|uniref:HPP family protein n=1 Tax=Sphingobium sp. SCG-1 TaxID=2072936 RepID=UPI001CB8908C|nr:HPP family protein [Sphingobium sp. SCG-1]